MRNESIIFLLSFVAVFAMAGINMSVPQDKEIKKARAGAVVADTLLKGQSPKDSKAVDKNTPDTARMDSLQLAIYHHNKTVNDSTRTNGVMRAHSDGIDTPIKYSVEDSLVYGAESGTAYSYSNSKVDCENMKLTSDKVHMSLDKSAVRAAGIIDFTTEGGIKGEPVFIMNRDEYKNDTMAFNFKSKKDLTRGIYTEQQDGLLSGEVGKRDSTGSIHLQYGHHTTCDKAHPDFCIALSRAKVYPDENAVFGPACLVMADVPLPLAIPCGFFPFPKKYSSGLTMSSYGDEDDCDFCLCDGGHYFTISDKWGSELLGEIYTKGS